MRRSSRRQSVPTGSFASEALTDGERWTREQLDALGEAGFAPSGVLRFLLASLRRSADVRAARPELVRQSRSWMAAGAGLWCALALARVEPYRSQVARGLAWWAVTAVMLEQHLGMVETLDGEPRPLGPADAATLVRAWLVPIAATRPTAIVCALGGASDALDGRLARATAPTRAGRDLEGLVDGCFIAASLVGLRRAGALGRKAAAAEAARVGAGVGYALVSYFGRRSPPRHDLLRAGRLTAAVRLGGLTVAAAGHRQAGTAILAAGTGLGSVQVLLSLRRSTPGATGSRARARART